MKNRELKRPHIYEPRSIVANGEISIRTGLVKTRVYKSADNNILSTVVNFARQHLKRDYFGLANRFFFSLRFSCRFRYTAITSTK